MGLGNCVVWVVALVVIACGVDGLGVWVAVLWFGEVFGFVGG